MPLPVENLTRQSSSEAIQEAISESIRLCIKEGEREEDVCKAMVYSMARKATGKPLKKKEKRKSRHLASGP